MKLRTIIGLVCLLLAYPCHARPITFTLDQLETQWGDIRKATEDEITAYKAAYTPPSGWTNRDRFYTILRSTEIESIAGTYFIFPKGFDKSEFRSYHQFSFFDMDSNQCYARLAEGTLPGCKKTGDFWGLEQHIVNIPAPEKNDPLYKKKAAIYYENVFVNSLFDGWPKIYSDSIEGVNKAAQHYLDALKAGVDDKIAFEKYQKAWQEAHLGYIIEDFGKNFVSAHVTAEISPQCKRILDSKAFIKQVDAIDFTDKNGAVYKFWTDYFGMGGYPYHRYSVNGSEQAIYYPIVWTGKVGYFELDGKLYHTDSNPGATQFDVFEFVPEFFHFKEVCEIKADVLSFDVIFGANNPVCDDVSKGRHQSYEIVSITDLMAEREYKTYHQDMCAVEATYGGVEDKNKTEACLVRKDVENDYYLAWGTSGGSKALKVDYNNDGKAEYLIDSFYSSGFGGGCYFNYLRVYDPIIKNTRDVTTGRVDESADDNYSYKISCRSGSQQIISIRGKNYLLTLNTEGIEQLHEITTREDGTDRKSVV